MLVDAAEKGWLPDAAVRAGIRALHGRRLREERARWDAADGDRLAAFIRELRDKPIAVNTEQANAQHYELPSDFFRRMLGPHRKYSSAYWPEGVERLEEAEEAMLRLTCRRAGIADGMRVLDLGCGWGSLTLWVAAHYPRAQVTAVSNSESQRETILDRAAQRGLGNVRIITADMNAFVPEGRFDRILSVEMFEHMRNPEALMRRAARWLRPEGKLFVHVFAHRDYAYLFDISGEMDWMARHFFTGGMMPSRRLLPALDSGLCPAREWSVNGRHYARTLHAWLERLDAQREAILALFRTVYGNEAGRWFRRWRLFLMACEELFGYEHGNEWFVAHYLFEQATC
ncbi:MAG: class I SAM-dependent methyltransferase [Kiritimatiellae bacterium]|nr:class I SAM-dependent methyltransferase [Kiritimatiellia bacterium]